MKSARWVHRGLGGWHASACMHTGEMLLAAWHPPLLALPLQAKELMCQSKWVLDRNLPTGLHAKTWDLLEKTLYMFMGMVHRLLGDQVVLSVTMVLQPMLLAKFLVCGHSHAELACHAACMAWVGAGAPPCHLTCHVCWLQGLLIWRGLSPGSIGNYFERVGYWVKYCQSKVCPLGCDRGKAMEVDEYVKVGLGWG